MATWPRYAFTIASSVTTSAESSKPTCARLVQRGWCAGACDRPISRALPRTDLGSGPFWIGAGARRARLPAAERSRLDGLFRELDALKKKPPVDIPQAVVVQDGGPNGTRHDGFKDSHVFLRGNSTRLGKIVPRGVPWILLGDGQPPVRITRGSGRRELAEWLVRPANPLTARVMVNRIWQHHFGEGLVRTPNDFGGTGRTTDKSRAAQLAGSTVCGIGLVGQDDASIDHAVVGLSNPQPGRLAAADP